MKKFFHAAARGMRSALVAVVSLVVTGAIIAVGANYQMTQGSGTTFASAVISAVNYVEFLLCDPTAGATQCAGVNASGQLAIAGPVTNAGTFAVQAAQSGTWNVTNVSGTVSLPTGASTAAKQPALGTAGTASTDVLTVQGIASMTPFLTNPGTIGTWGLVASTQNSSTPTNGHLVEGQFNTTPTTITSGNVSPLQLDDAGNLLVNIKAGAGSGGTAITDNAAFTTGTTSETPIGCYAGTPSATANHSTIVACTTGGSIHTTVDNTNSNGQATMANSSPVAIASNQSNLPVINGASKYNTVAASQTAQALTGGSGGATGDYLSHCVVTPGTTSPGVVTILDNSTAVVSFAGGSSSVSNLVEWTIPLGAVSASGAWKITTGANVTVVCVGKFT